MVYRCVIKLIGEELVEPLAHIFTECLKEGWFPDQSLMKEVSLLLRKDGKPEGASSAYRPIYLLSEIGKLLERVIAHRLITHMASNQEYNLAEEQYGFREYRSTVDAISKFKTWVEDKIQEGDGVTMAISDSSLDVANAFPSCGGL